MTQRERWYAFWRARRTFERHNNQVIARALIFGQSCDLVDASHPAHEYVLRAIDYAINPPIITDPELTCFRQKTKVTRPERRLP